MKKPSLVDSLLIILIGIVIVIFLMAAFVFQSPTPGPPPSMSDFFKKVEWENSTGQIKAYFQNYDDSQTIDRIYVNNKLDDRASIAPSRNIEHDQTCEITLSQRYSVMPQNVTITIQGTNGNYSQTTNFIGFEMIGLFWNETTQKTEAIIADNGTWSQVNFGKIYINGAADNASIITNVTNPYAADPYCMQQKWFKVSLPGTCASKPTSMTLDFSADGSTFHLTSPFNTNLGINEVKWDNKTGQVKFWVFSQNFDLEGKPIQFDKVYVNGVLQNAANISRVYSETYQITSSTTYEQAPSPLTLMVVTDYGACSSQQFVMTNYPVSTSVQFRVTWHQAYAPVISRHL
jgi:hypothetical protein